jgi:nuclear transport factor 2 (NTF2) superfamily protein
VNTVSPGTTDTPDWTSCWRPQRRVSNSYGNELWEFNDDGLMRRWESNINDLAIVESDWKPLWPAPGLREPDHPGIAEVE